MTAFTTLAGSIPLIVSTGAGGIRYRGYLVCYSCNVPFNFSEDASSGAC